MSVLGLSNTTVRVYKVTVSQDTYGANFETYTLRYGPTPVRIMQKKAKYESFINGKEQNVSDYRIYFPKQYTISNTDLIVDCVRGRKYDTLYVNMMNRKDHLQVDVKRIDSVINTLPLSSSSSYLYSTSSSSSSLNCPNNIYNWNGSVYTI